MPSSLSLRTIIIGDIHGCTRELDELLRITEASSKDRILCVGDLICKGPDSLGALLWAMQSKNVECVLGNHEARFLEYWKSGETPERKPYDYATFKQFGDRYDECMKFISSWPLYRNEPEFLLVHAGVDPRIEEMEKQDPSDLVKLRKLSDEEGAWYDHYHREKLIVFGHWVRREPLLRKNAIGIDTGCVYGGKLSALVLPERRIVQVSARREYRHKESWPA